MEKQNNSFLCGLLEMCKGQKKFFEEPPIEWRGTKNESNFLKSEAEKAIKYFETLKK